MVFPTVIWSWQKLSVCVSVCVREKGRERGEQGERESGGKGDREGKGEKDRESRGGTKGRREREITVQVANTISIKVACSY